MHECAVNWQAKEAHRRWRTILLTGLFSRQNEQFRGHHTHARARCTLCNNLLTLIVLVCCATGITTCNKWLQNARDDTLAVWSLASCCHTTREQRMRLHAKKGECCIVG